MYKYIFLTGFLFPNYEFSGQKKDLTKNLKKIAFEV